MTRTFIFLCFIAIVFIGCSKGGGTDPAPGPGGGGGGTPSPSCTGTPGALFNQVKAVVQANCALSGCHTGANPQNGINFSDNCTIVTMAARIKVRAVDEAGTANQMPQPPNPALSAADRKKIVDWINAGGKITD